MNHNLLKLANSMLDKVAFVGAGEIGAAAGMPAGQDPAMAGGMPPMDPSPMDPAMAGGMPPMDPAMAGGMPPMDPSTMGEPLPVDADGVPMGDFGDPESEKDDIKSEIREVLEETGVVKPVKAKPEEYQRWSVEAIEAIAKSLGVTLPDKPWMAAKGGPQGGEGGVGGLGVLAPGSSGEASHMPLEDSMGGGMFDDMSAPVKSASSISQRMRRRAMSV